MHTFRWLRRRRRGDDCDDQGKTIDVLTCDVAGCGNEVHTYCTLANPIEEFTCPKCEEKAQKKSLTKHPSLDARIAERRAAAGEEFKY